MTVFSVTRFDSLVMLMKRRASSRMGGGRESSRNGRGRQPLPVFAGRDNKSKGTGRVESGEGVVEATGAQESRGGVPGRGCGVACRGSACDRAQQTDTPCPRGLPSRAEAFRRRSGAGRGALYRHSRTTETVGGLLEFCFKRAKIGQP